MSLRKLNIKISYHNEIVFKPPWKEDACCKAKISEQLRIATRTTRTQSDPKNLLFDCILLLRSFASGSLAPQQLRGKGAGTEFVNETIKKPQQPGAMLFSTARIDS